jgi:hypothetical protein
LFAVHGRLYFGLVVLMVGHCFLYGCKGLMSGFQQSTVGIAAGEWLHGYLCFVAALLAGLLDGHCSGQGSILW